MKKDNDQILVMKKFLALSLSITISIIAPLNETNFIFWLKTHR